MSTSSKIYNKNGYIYKISDTNEKMCYIGSTFVGVTERFYQHKTDFKRFKLGKYKRNSCFDIFDKFGVDNTKIVLVETLDFPSKRQDLLKLEQKWIKATDCVNKYSAIRTKEDQKNYEQGYYKENKEKIQQAVKEYRSKPDVKEKIQERYKVYSQTEEAKKKHNERQKVYTEKQRQGNLEERKRIEEEKKIIEKNRPANFDNMTAKEKSDLRRKRARTRQKFIKLVCKLYQSKCENLREVVSDTKKTNNESGKTGVHYSNYDKCWVVQWHENGKRKKKTFRVCDNSGGNGKNNNHKLSRTFEEAKKLAEEFRMEN
jgi:hypothetical protein